MKKFSYLSVIALTLVASACNGSEDVILDNEFKNITISESDFDIINNSQYQFGGKIFNQLLDTDKDNFAISPLELYFTLGMISNITENDTQKEIIKFLNDNDKIIENVNKLSRTLLTNLPTVDKTADISLINAMWYSKSLCGEFDDNVKSTLSEYFNAKQHGFSSLDSDEAFNYINDWGKSSTNGMIPKIVSYLDPNSSIIFTSALYFKGKWKTPFDTKLTSHQVFNSENGEKNSVPMMKHRKLSAFGFGTDRYTVVSLPYGNTAYNMLIILPDEGKSLNECFTEEDMYRYQKLSTNNSRIDDTLIAQSKSLNILLPKFKLDTEMAMEDLLKNLGIRKVFNDSEAKFTGFKGSSVMMLNRISQISQIIVDETGCKAANVSVGELMASSDYSEMSDFIVNRPFAFLITERSTGSILFMGRINNL